MIDYFKKKERSERAEDEVLFEYVIDEMDVAEPIKGLWAKAIAHSEGNSDKAKSKYMQFRVQSIKDECDVLKINFNEMQKEQLFEAIKNGFKEQHDKFEAYNKEEERIEEEKYNKIGGWLIVHGLFLIIGAAIMLLKIAGAYFSNEFEDNLLQLYINNDIDSINAINNLVYLSAFGLFMTVLLLLSFFSRSYITKNVVILLALSNLVIFPLIGYLQYGISPELATKNIGLFLWALIWVLIIVPYYVFSKRVKKTFVNRKDSGTNIILISLFLTSLFIIPYMYSQPSETDIRYKIEGMADNSFEEEDYNSAVKLYTNLVDRGHYFDDDYSIAKLAYSYDKTNDVDNALKYYLQYDQKGENASVKRNIGLIYQSKKDYKKSTKWFKQAFNLAIKQARDGDKFSMRLVVLMYQNGEGTKKDLEKSNYWDKKYKSK